MLRQVCVISLVRSKTTVLVVIWIRMTMAGLVFGPISVQKSRKMEIHQVVCYPTSGRPRLSCDDMIATLGTGASRRHPPKTK